MPIESTEASGTGEGPQHTKDEDCTVVDGECSTCSVAHGPRCHVCGASAFHKDGCPEIG
jgi:hypothetical protein